MPLNDSCNRTTIKRSEWRSGTQEHSPEIGVLGSAVLQMLDDGFADRLHERQQHLLSALLGADADFHEWCQSMSFKSSWAAGDTLDAIRHHQDNNGVVPRSNRCALFGDRFEHCFRAMHPPFPWAMRRGDTTGRKESDLKNLPACNDAWRSSGKTSRKTPESEPGFAVLFRK